MADEKFVRMPLHFNELHNYIMYSFHNGMLYMTAIINFLQLGTLCFFGI